MRVICIREPKTPISKYTGKPPIIKVGSFYNVIEVVHAIFEIGEGYRLAEDPEHTYSHTFFAPLEGDEAPELEEVVEEEIAAF